MRLGLTTEGAETPVRAARKEACERIRFAQLGRNSPTLDGRQMICGRGVDEWHEVRLPPSSFRAPRSGFPRFQWLTDLSTAPPASSAPLRQTGASTTRPSRHKWTLHFLFTPPEIPPLRFARAFCYNLDVRLRGGKTTAMPGVRFPAWLGRRTVASRRVWDASSEKPRKLQTRKDA